MSSIRKAWSSWKDQTRPRRKLSDILPDEVIRQLAPNQEKDLTAGEIETLRKKARLLGEGLEKLPDDLLLHRFRELARSMAAKQLDAVLIYRPLLMARKFHESKARQRLLRGSNRAGKTLTAAMEVARAVRGLDPKYPKEDGICYAVTTDYKLIGEVVWRKLARAGAFQIIFDDRPEQNRWRAVVPDDKYDRDRKDRWKPSPPLLRGSDIEDIAWYDRKRQIPLVVRLKTGWEIHFYSSDGVPPTGVAIDLCWFDEEIRVDWHPEMQARLVDRMGKFFWSATPQTGTQRLFELHEMANQGGSDIEEFVLQIEDNFYLPKKAKEEFKASLDPDEIEVRYFGNFAIHATKVYPEFSDRVHGVEAFVIPRDWTIYIAIDPGRQVAACLFAAIPPDVDEIHLWDEVYMRQADIPRFAEAVKSKLGDIQPYAMIIDHQMSRIHQVGDARMLEEFYMDEFRKNKIRSTSMGYAFHWGSTDVQARTAALRKCLYIRPTGRPRLRCHLGKVNNFMMEMGKQYYKRDPKGMITDDRIRKNDHLVACAEYLVMHDLRWITPPKSGRKDGGGDAYRRFLKKKKKAANGEPKVSLGKIR